MGLVSADAPNQPITRELVLKGESVADTLSDEGRSTFSKIAASNAFLDRMKGDNLMLVAEDNGKVEGIIELK